MLVSGPDSCCRAAASCSLVAAPKALFWPWVSTRHLSLILIHCHDPRLDPLSVSDMMMSTPTPADESRSHVHTSVPTSLSGYDPPSEPMNHDCASRDRISVRVNPCDLATNRDLGGDRPVTASIKQEHASAARHVTAGSPSDHPCSYHARHDSPSMTSRGRPETKPIEP